MKDGLTKKLFHIWYAADSELSDCCQDRSYKGQNCPTARGQMKKIQNHYEIGKSTCQGTGWGVTV